MELMRLDSAVADEIDMDRVKARAEAINRYERTFRAEDFEQSSRYCEQMLKDAGFSGVERYALKMDGRTANLDCIMPQAWSIQPGSFCRIEDGDVPENLRMVADYAADHFSCGIWSAPTPPEGIRAELIDSRSITDETDLTGKFILATESCANFYKLGVRRGASGILMFNGSAEAAEDFPDFRRWGNGIGLTGWYHAREDRRLVVYHITPRQGIWLHDRLKKGPLHLHAVMNSKIFDGEIWTVSGVIPGEKKDEEIVLLAHLYEPFLTDDALGPASSVEICTVLRNLAEKKIIGPLKKSLRVVFSMELFGFSEYFSRRENVHRTFYAVSLDGIGTFNTWKPDEKKTVNLRLTTGTAPFISDLLYREYFREKDSLNTVETRGNLSDDTFGEDPMIRKICGEMSGAADGIPVNWLRTCILPYHHNTGPMFNSADWDLAREIILAYCTILGIVATEDRETLHSLMERLEDLADRELTGIFEQTEKQLQNGTLSLPEAGMRNQYWRELEKKLLLSSNWIAPGTAAESELERMLRPLPELAGPERPESEIERQLAGMVVTRLTAGIPHSLAKVPAKERAKPSNLPDFPVLMTFLDGKRDLLNAVRLTRFDQLKEKCYTEKQLKDLADYLRYLERYGYVSIRETR